MTTNRNEQDPWTWGVEDNAVDESQQNDWNNWNTSTSVPPDYSSTKEIPNQLGPSSNVGSDYFDNVNLHNHNAAPFQRNWAQSGELGQTNFANHLPQSSTPNFINNNSNHTDVENKEVAPPDNQYNNRNSRQPSASKHGRKEQTTAVSTSQPNSGPMSVPSYGSKQEHLLQDNTVRHPVHHQKPMFDPLPPNVPYTPSGQQHYNVIQTSQSSSNYFNSHPFQTESMPRHQMPLTDAPLQKQIDSHPFPPLHSVQPNNPLDYSSHYSKPPSSTPPQAPTTSNSAHDAIRKEKLGLYSHSGTASQNHFHQLHDGLSTQERSISHKSQQNLMNNDRLSSVFNTPSVTKSEISSGQTDFIPQYPNSNVFPEEVNSIQTSSLPRQEAKNTIEAPVKQQYPQQVSYQPQVSQHSQVSQQSHISQSSQVLQQPQIGQQPQTPYQQPQVSQQSQVLYHPQASQQSQIPQQTQAHYQQPQVSQSSHIHYQQPQVPRPPQTHYQTQVSQQPHPQHYQHSQVPQQSEITDISQLTQIPYHPQLPPQQSDIPQQVQVPNQPQVPYQSQSSVSYPPPPPVSYQSATSFQLPPVSQEVPLSDQRSSSHHLPVVYQTSSIQELPSTTTQQIQEDNDTNNFPPQKLNATQQDIQSHSPTFQTNITKGFVNNSVIETSSGQSDVNHIANPGLSSYNKDRGEPDLANQARYTPSPQQAMPSTTVSQHVKIPQNINSSQLSTTIENSSLDNETVNCNVSNVRSQISLNYQNIHPMASSSPLPVQNIPENQERLPENREMPDNTENLNLHRDMKNLNLNKEVEDDDTQILCQVDRDQYLETGHLSGSKDHILTDNSPNVEAVDEGDAPPPGLHRLVTGQGCESRATLLDHPPMIGADSSILPDDNRHSSPSPSTVGSDNRNSQSGPVGESEIHSRAGRRLVQGRSIGDDTDGFREVPGEATSCQRIVVGQMGRGDNTRGGEVRMALSEQHSRDQLPQNVGAQEDYRQSHRSLRRSRRAESSYEEEDHDYPSDRDRRDDYKRRGDDRVRHRTRREHRSPDYRSDEEFEERRGFTRMGRSERRSRDFSPEMSYNYNNSYRDNYRDDHRRHRRCDHYREYDDDCYYRENRSRPSSRTGSDYRRMNIDYGYGRMNQRHMGYADPGAYNQRAQQQYLEFLRTSDPAGYAAWYFQYMSSRYGQQVQQHYNTDRASVHSGQSSTNNRPNVETPNASFEDNGRNDDTLGNSIKIKGKIDIHSRMLVFDPQVDDEEQKPTIKVYNISKLTIEPDVTELLETPGPFIPEVTHRNTVLQYLKGISERSNKSSEKLLYDLIYLSVKSNGELNGLDVADLLMESYKKSQVEEKQELPVEQFSITTISKFRELLQQGNKTDALEWAMANGAWGHALFLASKMGEKTHNNIMLRFANSFPHTDTLQTLYQLMSGHVPQASTSCADKEWSDWRPHLAMILGNPTSNSKLDRKAIIKLGDSLFSRGRIFASHFCYIAAQAEFTTYQKNAKLVLLGSNPSENFNKFATCRAIMATICYEYGMKLRQPNANIPSLLLYKLILATRLIDHGKNLIALEYCEMIANEILRSTCCERSVMISVIDLSSKLKMLDSSLAMIGDTEVDPEWLAKLKKHYNNLPESYDADLAAMSHGISSSTVSEVGQDLVPSYSGKIEMNNDNLNPYKNEPMSNSNKVEYNMIPAVQPILRPMEPLHVDTALPSTDVGHHEDLMRPSYQPNSLPPLSSNTYPTESFQPQIDPYWSSSNGITASANSYQRQDSVETTVSNSKNNFFKASEEQLKLNEISKESNRTTNKPVDNKPNKSEETQNSGWFGGILEKLSIRPKNQMRLPDDSNPSIVWDEQKKKWVNLEGDDEGPAAIKPPPRMAETVKPQLQPSDNLSSAMPPPLPGGNKYKLQKGKLMKSNYVNVMGTTTKSQPGPAPIDGLFPTPVQPSNTSFFIPPPVEGGDYTPLDYNKQGNVTNNNKQDGNPENKQDYSHGVNAPAMYHPSRYPISNDC